MCSDVSNHQKNTNKNPNKISRMTIIKKACTGVGEGREKRKHLHTVGV
jgi:hypothetical protein